MAATQKLELSETEGSIVASGVRYAPPEKVLKKSLEFSAYCKQFYMCWEFEFEIV